jgi:uncharacterized repeat protein (TIGR04042 family)
MPEMTFTLRRPDGTEERRHSPSTVITELFEAGRDNPLDDLLMRARLGLERASSRVAARYDRPCSLALAQLARIEARAAEFACDPDVAVSCTSIEGDAR